ncbi:phospholipase D family protein [Acinetobacter piscicola]|uniref:phospholipase D family protein n=1 Tax=Acinetobacter piscicola TaxID=2006115 RepID=UPI00101FE072|nr:phospholipase D family protein [Acinetobacter piscicola]RYL25963.1 phospholipase [Acinetobacter piscicola]
MRIFHKIHSKLNWSKRRYLSLIFAALALGYLSSAIYHTVKSLPQGLNFTGPLRYADVKFIADETYIDAQGKQQLDHHIFDQILALIKQAKTTIVVDMFLFNSEVGESKVQQRALTHQLTEALINQKVVNPTLEIKFITDPINSVYGGIAPEQYRKLRQGGIEVIETNLTPLRASNPTWSGFWYLCCQDVGNNAEKGWLNNPFGKEPITLRSYLNLFNFKANHRKTIVVDTNEGWKTIVTSANPHDGSSRHSNVALMVNGAVATDVLKSEQPVAQMSGGDTPFVIVGKLPESPANPQVQVLTEHAIYDAVLNLLDSAKANDQIDLAMFYLSERKIVKGLIAAKQRGVKLRILLDPNKDAFGRQKNGIPNRQVASELHDAGVDVRWCNTQGEQCHSKMIVKRNEQSAELILGSANFTARNLKNYNLETDLRVVGHPQQQVFVDATQYFNTAWSNLNGRNMSVDYSKFADESTFKYGVYRFMEWSGLSTF